MYKGQIGVYGDIGNISENIIKELSKIGKFPEEIRVSNRLLTLNEEKGLLFANVTFYVGK